MKRRYRVLGGTAIVLVGLVGVLGFVLSLEAPCPSPVPSGSGMAAPGSSGAMQAVRQRCYGAPESLRLEVVPRPAPTARELLVEVHVAATNALDWHYLRGTPYVMRLMSGIRTPGDAAFGVDFAGVVAAVGDSVRRFAVGDSVFGSRTGAFGEFLTISETSAVARMPHDASFESAAAIPVAATTALQALRDHGQVTAGEAVLVNGGSGGVGTYALQLAKSMGARVTGVASTRNQELMRSLGADVTIDYTRTNFTLDTARYDVIIDMVGNHPPSALRGVLAPGGRAVLVGGPDGDRWLGPLRSSIGFFVYDLFADDTFTGMIAHNSASDLEQLAGLMARGQLRSVIDQRFTLAQVGEAISYQEAGRSRGKNVIVVR